MIITEKKQKEALLQSLKGFDKLFLTACGGCAAKSLTADEKSVKEIMDFLVSNGKTILESAVIESVCDMRLVKKTLSRNENMQKADVVVALSCGAGVQSIESVLKEKNIIPALDSKYIGSTKRIGIYKKFCSVCGSCILDQTQGICPRTRCAKSLVNGPCGGFVNGKCEIDQNTDCAWVLIYEKLKNNGKCQDFLNQYVVPL
ncbi:MAG: methylenetetrahydrofolate reductase C-terminal domain-containing protein [Elusimicrobiota bacterium]|jgi:hypothetical protein|nr:methylenetetrahydrofolate reductase C-terminal domain-containing protein [Elusimicrobiota bacterium]